MMRLKEHYQKDIIPALKTQFSFKNVFEVPKLEKVLINVGINSQNKDAKLVDTACETLKRITGQAPVKTKAKKSIAGFKVREGMVVGVKVTLRGQRMYDFIEKLIKVALPRIRDFRGLSPKGIDGHGNFTIGFRESVAFPEVQGDTLERTHGLEITVVTTSENKEQGLALLKLLGFPFREKEK